jgi:hypothetical protein
VILPGVTFADNREYSNKSKVDFAFYQQPLRAIYIINQHRHEIAVFNYINEDLAF